jgi:hypothetical protein
MDIEKMDALAGSLAELDDELTPRTPEQREAEEKAAAEADPEFQAKAWAEMAQALGGMLSMIAPELQQVYTDKACLQWGRSVVPVAEKYGWNGPSSIPELGLLIASVPLVVPTAFILNARIKALRKAKAEADEARTVDMPSPAGGAS